MNKRIYVEKKDAYRVEANSLLKELNENLSLKLSSLRLLNVYDIFGIEEDLFRKSLYQVFGEIVTDNVYEEFSLQGKDYLAIEYLPGQFDQRGESASACLRLIQPESKARVRSARLIVFADKLTAEEKAKIEHYLVNAVECRKKDLSVLKEEHDATIKEVPVLKGFTSLKGEERDKFIAEKGLAMNRDDLQCVIDYFKKEGRDPFETELRILDTYWSDHCRHTTFHTALSNITIEDSYLSKEIQEAYTLYLSMRDEIGETGKKDICLMDMATIGAKVLHKEGYLDDLEVSEENNACSIYINAHVDGKSEPWLLMFKNETHNHPTEIEPFGGASTCLGGAIRDPLSGRSYVYQAMRVTGASNIFAPYEDTLEGKLPQKVISLKAAQGYSSYGNQIGLATTYVREVYHEGYVAKRLEVGAVVGAVKADEVRREAPLPGDIVLLLGGRTGRDGIGGATGSSKNHNTHSLETCASEVQKGNAPEERKLQHLFRRKEAVRLIKKSNDFGAGGVSVAIGELAPGLAINLDKVPVKYLGLNATELAISESQERMAVVVDSKDEAEFSKYCHEENIEVSHVAEVTEEPRMKMYFHGKCYCDLARSFIDSAGAKHHSECTIKAKEKEELLTRKVSDFKKDSLKLLSSPNVCSQKGLVEMFDSTIGRSTVLLPYGGKYQLSETQVSVQKLPVGEDHYTDDASIMAYGYDPYLTSLSPFLGSQYAILDSIAKVVAAGGDYSHMRYSYQEYFKKMESKEDFGEPFQALLGAIKMQKEFHLPSIGGKDSMSGSFASLHVPPMLMAFGITMVDASKVISDDFKKSGDYLYLLKHHPLSNETINVEEEKKHFTSLHKAIDEGKVLSCYALGFGGLFEALVKCSLGNRVGFKVNMDEAEALAKGYGSFLIESEEKLDLEDALLIGQTTDDIYQINDVTYSFEELYNACFKEYAKAYPIVTDKITEDYSLPYSGEKITYPYRKKEHPLVFIPVFPGTNCDYDSAKAFKKAGAKVKTMVFRNLTSEDVNESLKEMASSIDTADILMLAGGFSAADEPDGSGKFIAAILDNPLIRKAIEGLLSRKGLILGICNGFQALIKCGLLPYGKFDSLTSTSPTLFHNDINRHISHIATTKVVSTLSPWLTSFRPGEIYQVPISHGEGKFVCSKEMAESLFFHHQVAFQYATKEGKVATRSEDNPNGSTCAIEGITSPNGLILGKMGHSERYEKNCFKNIQGNKEEDIFLNAVNYFRKK